MLESRSRSLRLLSFDGGGIRALSGLWMLNEILNRFYYDNKIQPKPNWLFDVVCGSGTGGLCALLIGRLGFTVQQAIDQFIRVALVAYSKNPMDKMERTARLREVLELVVQDAKLNVDVRMIEERNKFCETFVCTTSCEDAQSVVLFRSYRARNSTSYNCTIVDAALATLSTPELFLPVKIGEHGQEGDFFDASFVRNNPIEELLREVRDLYDPATRVRTIISFGCGKITAAFGADIGSTIRSIALSGERAHEDLQYRMKKLGVYFRFNVERNMDLHEIVDISKVQSSTDSYRNQELVGQKMDEVVEAWLPSQGGVSIGFINQPVVPSTNQPPTNHDGSTFDSTMTTADLEEQQFNIDADFIINLPHVPSLGNHHEICLDGTRVHILDVIRKWSNDPDTDQRIFWLCDVPGSGKSTIAKTMANEWSNTGQLAAQYFFSQYALSFSNSMFFCSSVLKDMTAKFHGLRPLAVKAIRNDAFLATRDLLTQFEEMIINPIRTLGRRVIFVFDAIDEFDSSLQKQLVYVLIKFAKELENVKFFITSRPTDLIIPALVSSPVVQAARSQLFDPTDSRDISRYIHYHVKKLTKEQCDILVDHARGLFIWASIAVREINKHDFVDPEILFKPFADPKNAGNLEALYSGIFDRATSDENARQSLFRALGVLSVLQEPLSVTALQQLLPQLNLRRSLAGVRTILLYDHENDPILFFHPSLAEYIISLQIQQFSTELMQTRKDLTNRTLDLLLASLRSDICRVNFPETKPSYLFQKLHSHIPASLQYSAAYWCIHATLSISDAEIWRKINHLFETQLLNWIEVISYTGNFLLCLKSLRRLFTFISKNSTRENVDSSIWCWNTIKLLQSQQESIEADPLNIHGPALAFVPTKTYLMKQYGALVRDKIPRMISGIDDGWTGLYTLRGHTFDATCIAFSPDGYKVATGSLDQTIRLWDSETGASLVKPLSEHKHIVEHVSFSGDGLHLASYSKYGVVWLWNTEDGTGRLLDDASGEIHCLAFSSRGPYLAIGATREVVRLWDYQKEELRLLNGHFGSIQALSFSIDGRLASGSRDTTIRLWTGLSESITSQQIMGRDPVTQVIFSPNGSKLVSTHYSTDLCLWDTQTRERWGPRLKMRGDKISSARFSTDGCFLVSIGLKGALQIWEVKTGREATCRLTLPHDTIFTSLSPDCSKILTSSHTVIQLWDVYEGLRIGAPVEGKHATCAVFSPNGKQLVYQPALRCLSLWDTELDMARDGDVLPRKPHGILFLEWSGNGNRLVAAFINQTMQFWDVATSTYIERREGSSTICHIALSYTGDRAISIAGDNTLTLWDGSNGDVLAKVSGFGNIKSVALSPDGNHFATLVGDALQLWDLRTFSRITSRERAIDLAAPFLEGVSFSSDGSLLRVNFHAFLILLPELKPVPASQLRTNAFVRRSCISYELQAHLIQVLGRSKHIFKLPADIGISVWRAFQGFIALGTDDGRVVIMDCKHLI